MTFPQRSPHWLFTNAARGGLEPLPVQRLRGARPHLLRSCAHFIRARGALAGCYTQSKGHFRPQFESLNQPVP
jgi:hypothetical protein